MNLKLNLSLILSFLFLNCSILYPTKNPNLKEFVDDPASEIIVVQVNAVQLLDGIKDSYFEIVT
jgi:hypothetical protein